MYSGFALIFQRPTAEVRPSGLQVREVQLIQHGSRSSVCHLQGTPLTYRGRLIQPAWAGLASYSRRHVARPLWARDFIGAAWWQVMTVRNRNGERLAQWGERSSKRHARRHLTTGKMGLIEQRRCRATAHGDIPRHGGRIDGFNAFNFSRRARMCLDPGRRWFD